MVRFNRGCQNLHAKAMTGTAETGMLQEQDYMLQVKQLLNFVPIANLKS